MKHYLFALVLATVLNGAGTAAFAANNDDETPGQWVCFAHDYVDGHSKNDPETEDCIQSYHKGEGICLSHAKSASIERCLSYSKNKASCKIDVYKNCFRANARPSSRSGR